MKIERTCGSYYYATWNGYKTSGDTHFEAIKKMLLLINLKK